MLSYRIFRLFEMCVTYFDNDTGLTAPVETRIDKTTLPFAELTGKIPLDSFPFRGLVQLNCRSDVAIRRERKEYLERSYIASRTCCREEWCSATSNRGHRR